MKALDKDFSNEQIYNSISPGDELVLDLKGEEKVRVVVTKVTADHIEADGQTYKFQDIKEIQKKGISVWKTAGAAAAAYIMVGVIALVSLLN